MVVVPELIDINGSEGCKHDLVLIHPPAGHNLGLPDISTPIPQTQHQ
jgi:hypothetical protein